MRQERILGRTGGGEQRRNSRTFSKATQALGCIAQDRGVVGGLGRGSAGPDQFRQPGGILRIILPDRALHGHGQRLFVHRRRGNQAGQPRLPFLARRLRRAGLANAINGAQHIRLRQLGTRATQLVPSTGIHHEQVAIGILQDVGGMKIRIPFPGCQQVAVRTRIAGALGTEHVAGDFVEIEGGRKQVVPILGAPGIAFVAHQPALRGGTCLVKRMKQIRPGPRYPAVVEDVIFLAVHTAVNRMGHAIAEARLGEVDERAAEDRFTLGGEGDFHRIVHASGHDDIQPRPIRQRAVNVRRLVLQHPAVGQRVRLFGECPLGPIQIAIRTQMRPVDVVGAPGQGAALEPLLPTVRHAVAVGVGKLPDAGRTRHIHRTAVPEASLGKHHLVGEHHRLVEHPVAVGVLQAQDAVGGILQLLVRRLIGSGRIRHVEASLVIETGAHRAWRDSGKVGPLHRKALGHGEAVPIEVEFGGPGRKKSGTEHRQDQPTRRRNSHDLTLSRRRWTG